MSLESIINEIADQADEILEDAKGRSQARAAIEEQITILHPELELAERKHVVDGVFSVLDAEGFFEVGSSSGAAGADDGVDEDQVGGSR